MAANGAPLKEPFGATVWDEIVQGTCWIEYIVWRMQKLRWTAHQKRDGQYGTTPATPPARYLEVLRAG